jgi:hypothetical protein
MDHRRSGDVPASGDQPEGNRDVSVPRVGTQVNPVTLREFEDVIRKDFVSPGPYPTYILPSTKKSTLPPTANPFAAPSNTSASPSYGQRYPSPPKPVFPPPQTNVDTGFLTITLGKYVVIFECFVSWK